MEKQNSSTSSMKTQPRQLDIVIAFVIFLACCLLSCLS